MERIDIVTILNFLFNEYGVYFSTYFSLLSFLSAMFVASVCMFVCLFEAGSKCSMEPNMVLELATLSSRPELGSRVEPSTYPNVCSLYCTGVIKFIPKYFMVLMLS